MKYIDAQDENPMERLDIVRGLEKTPDDENPFAELDALYRHILASVKSKHLPTVMRVLQVTLSLSDGQIGEDPARNLRNNLTSFLDLKPGELEYCLGNLEGILFGTQQSTHMPSVKFYHASFSDFLLNESQSGPYFIDLSLAHTQFIVYLFRHILHVDDTANTASASTPPPDDLNLVVMITIQSVLTRLPFAALTEELHQMLHFVTNTAAAQVIRNVTTNLPIGPPPPFKEKKLFSWGLVTKFATALGELSFNDAMVLKHNFLDEVKKYVFQELPKYREEPLCHLIPLLMMDSPISSYLSSDNSFYSFIVSRFMRDDYVLRLDRTSLSLEKSLWITFLGGYDSSCSLPRQLIKEISYDIKPEAYAAAFLCVLKCLSDLSPLVISPSDAEEFVLARFVCSGLECIEQYLTNREPSNKRPYIPRKVVALWHVFCGLGGPLLEKAGPSMVLQKCLKENKRIIYLFSQMDNNEVRQQTMWKTIKEAIDQYFLRCSSQRVTETRIPGVRTTCMDSTTILRVRYDSNHLYPDHIATEQRRESKTMVFQVSSWYNYHESTSLTLTPQCLVCGVVAFMVAADGVYGKVKCGRPNCQLLLSPKMVHDNADGIGGRAYVSCFGTNESAHPLWSQFVQYPDPPAPTPIQPPVLTVPSLSSGASGSQTGTDTDGKLCAIGGCKKGPVNKKCIRQVCAAHCRMMGGCAINQYTMSGNTHGLALSDEHGPPPLASALNSTQPLLPSPASLNLASHLNEVMTAPSGAEPPSSMNPLPNLALQMRLISMEQMAEQSLQEKRWLAEAARLEAIKKVKQSVTVCAWLKDDEPPEECIFQDGFVWPNFVLTPSVLADVGLDSIAADSWICVYNHMRRSWQRVKPNHVSSVDVHADIYVKAVSVKRYPQLEDYLALASQSRSPHFYNLCSECRG